MLRDGKAVRVYRQGTGAWDTSVEACSRPAGVPAKSPAPPVETPPDAQADQPVSSFMKVLLEFNPGMLEPELIDGRDVNETADMVDLDVAYSPVLERRDDIHPVDATALGDGRYRVYGTGYRHAGHDGATDVDAGSLKVMRARYLLRRGEIMRTMPYADPEMRKRIERTFWPKGDVPYTPPAGSPLAEMGRLRQSKITIPRNGDAPIDFAALIKSLSTPGAPIPDVAPTLPRSDDQANQ